MDIGCTTRTVHFCRTFAIRFLSMCVLVITKVRNDYYLDSMPPNNIGVSGTLTRKNIIRILFRMDFIPEILFRKIWNGPENYYAWTWEMRCLLFWMCIEQNVMIPFVAKPQGWNWTLGQPQYNWLLNTHKAVQRVYKLVFGIICVVRVVVQFGSTII